jgi:hypothetical protein
MTGAIWIPFEAKMALFFIADYVLCIVGILYLTLSLGSHWTIPLLLVGAAIPALTIFIGVLIFYLIIDFARGSPIFG